MEGLLYLLDLSNFVLTSFLLVATIRKQDVQAETVYPLIASCVCRTIH